MQAKRLFAALSFAVALVAVASAPALGDPTIYVDPEEQWVYQFEFVAVNVVVNDEVLGLTGFDLLIDYNEAVLNLYEVQEGPLPSSGGAESFFFWTDVAQPSNAILIQGAVLGDSVDGPGVLATIIFQGWVVGDSPVTFEEIDLRDLDNNPIPVAFADGMIHIMEVPTPVTLASWGRIKALYE